MNASSTLRPMDITTHRAASCAALCAALSAVLTGCGGSHHTASSAPSSAAPTASAATPSATSEAPSSSPSAAPLSVGQSGTFTATDSASDATTTMSVAVVSARYVTPAQVGTTNKSKGQYVDLKLTIKNVGTGPGHVLLYGSMKWEDASTAAQDASTLESVGSGPDLDTSYKPGQAVTGDVILDVGRRDGTVSYWDDPFGERPSFTVALPSA